MRPNDHAALGTDIPGHRGGTGGSAVKTILIALASTVVLCANAMPIGLRTAMVSPTAVSPNTLPRIAEDADAGVLRSFPGYGG